MYHLQQAIGILIDNMCHSRSLCHSRAGGNPFFCWLNGLMGPRLRGDDRERGDDKERRDNRELGDDKE